jgi:hypothetical protein
LLNEIIQVIALPVGAFLDTFGPLASSILGAAIFTLGAFAFGLGWEQPGQLFHPANIVPR